jgi:hypothetical protein
MIKMVFDPPNRLKGYRSGVKVLAKFREVISPIPSNGKVEMQIEFLFYRFQEVELLLGF